VKTYRKAGEDHKYFASLADTEIFEHELAYALLPLLQGAAVLRWQRLRSRLLHARRRRLRRNKPGGATRAAKMVVLEVDHPDIEDSGIAGRDHVP
jgi:hypothetical protein